MTPVVLISVSDSTQGGTSRSAIAVGRCWRDAGYYVYFYNRRGFSAQRHSDAATVGEVVPDANSLRTLRPSILNIHHKAPSGDEVSCVRQVLENIPNGPSLPVLTHNIFGRSIRRFVRHSGPWVEGVLGAWVAAQLRWSRWPERQSIAVVPNPQDSSIFRPPTDLERETARAAHGMHRTEHVILRAGSPLAGKWSDAYYELARSLDRGQTLVLVGAPDAVVHACQAQGTNVVAIPPIEETTALRDWYWSADTFAHWADRGESFGNVILEAILCGTPVVYMERRTRDNTPFELGGLSAVKSCRSRTEWLAESLRPTRDTVPDSDVDQVRDRYSYASVSAKLLEIGDALLAGRQVPKSLAASSIGHRNNALVGLRHNLLATVAKDVRVRVAR